MTDPHRGPLHERHAARGAKFAEFGGWLMPLSYAGGGALAEHAAVRENVGLFDVSHLGKAEVRGPGAAGHVDACLTADLGKISPGKAQYTLCCTESGGVVDDLIAYLHGPDRVFLVPNAANCATVAGLLAAAAPAGVEVSNRHTEFAILAVQGPRSAELLAAAGLPTELPYMAFRVAARGGHDVVVCRTGYTGEHGYELVVPNAVAGPLWDELLAAGGSFGVRPCGLAARDTLRTEMGYPLHGQDITPEVSPVQARLTFAVGWKKPAFWGREALRAERAAGPRRLLRGLRAAGRGIPRPHMAVRDEAGAVVGEVTSGTFSPTLRVGIGLALLDAAVAEGASLVLDARGRSEPCTVVAPPFVPSHVRD